MGLERDLGMEALKQGDFEAAIEHLERSRHETPGDFQVLFCLSGAYHQTKRDNEAVQVLSEALALRPYDAHVHYNLGICLDRVQRRREAIAALQCALVMQPEYPLAWHVLNRWLEAEGKTIQQAPENKAAVPGAAPSLPRPQALPAQIDLSPQNSQAASSPPSVFDDTNRPAIPGKRPRRRTLPPGWKVAEVTRSVESVPYPTLLPAEPATDPPKAREIDRSPWPDITADAPSSMAPTIRFTEETIAAPAAPRQTNPSLVRADGAGPIIASSSSAVPAEAASPLSTPSAGTESELPVRRRALPADEAPERSDPNPTFVRATRLQEAVIETVSAYQQESVPCPLAVEALKLALGSLFLVGLFLGPMAISRGVEARRWIADSPYWTGDGYARAAIVLGVIGTVASCVELLFLFFKI